MELLNQRLEYRPTRSLLAGNTAIFWQDIDLRIDPDPFYTSCHIYTINKNPIPKTPMNPSTPFKWVFMDIILAASSKILTKDTYFDNYFLIVDAY